MFPFWSKMTDHARRSLQLSNDFAIDNKNSLLTNLHLLWGLVEEGKNVAFAVIKNINTDTAKLQRDIKFLLPNERYQSNEIALPYAEDVRQCICEAISLGLPGPLTCHHLLEAILLDTDNPAAILLKKHDVTEELVKAYLQSIMKSAA